MTVLATQNLLPLTCTTTHQNSGGIGVTLSESNRPGSDISSTGLTPMESVFEFSRTRACSIGHLWFRQTLYIQAVFGLLAIQNIDHKLPRLVHKVRE